MTEHKHTLHMSLLLLGRTKYKGVWKPWCQRVLLLGLSEGRQWRFANVDSLPGKYVICLVNFFEVFESISMISLNCMCGTIRKATSRTLSLVDLNFSFDLISFFLSLALCISQMQMFKYKVPQLNFIYIKHLTSWVWIVEQRRTSSSRLCLPNQS